MKMAIGKEVHYWNWIERVFNRIPIPYSLVSFFLTIILALIYEVFSIKIKGFDWGFNKFDSFVLSVLIGFLILGNILFLDRMKSTFGKITFLPGDQNLGNDLLYKIQKNFTSSKLYHFAVIALVLVPFLGIKSIDFSKVGFDIFYYNEEPTYWAIVLDLYDNFLNFFSLYLLANILWIAINISWAINIVSEEPFRSSIEIDLFTADKTGGLKPFKNFILLFTIYYFVIVVLAVVSWLTPMGLPVYQTIFLFMIWIIGVIFFICSLYKIRNLFNGKIETEVNRINALCRKKTKQLSDILSRDSPEEDEKRLNQLSSALDILHKERDRVLEFHARFIDVQTIFFFLSSASSSFELIRKNLEVATQINASIASLHPLISQSMISSHILH
ncbi:Uncharacterised protein [uncultured archaeon]|nr:Uncharacterised protein [uncultured archaeon]